MASTQIEKARSAATNLRRAARERQDKLFSTGVALGTAFGYGFMRGNNTITQQFFGVDSDLLVGAGSLVFGLAQRPGSRIAEPMEYIGIAVLGGWMRDMGVRQGETRGGGGG